jgi:hypothetical protein
MGWGQAARAGVGWRLGSGSGVGQELPDRLGGRIVQTIAVVTA